ncbi:hypothetical protein [Pseudomonas leptonychotis]|uniref:hypothetical protein n=1 Tax=Pseudomonas leptonychotis TaxID=2448482 RepID=UPI00386D47DD
MSDEEFRDELGKPIATIRIDMDEFRRQGLGGLFRIAMCELPDREPTPDTDLQPGLILLATPQPCRADPL